MRSRRMLLSAAVCGLLFGALSDLIAGANDGRFDIYFIDVEGGAATLLVSPADHSVLIDSGYPDNGGRDLKRVLQVVRETAGLAKLDHTFVTHWHRDHYGNHAPLAAELPISKFWHRGIPDALEEDREFSERIAQYRAASQDRSKPMKAGNEFSLPSEPLPVRMQVVAANRKVIPNEGPANPFAARFQPVDEDPTDNAASLSTLWSFGDFRFLCCGDLTWNVEGRLVTPKNPLGQVDLFMVTHHGLSSSNNPALVLAIDPVVAVMCNGPTKGGHAQTLATLKEVHSLEALYQLHRNVELPDAEQTPAEFIANRERTANCDGVWVKVSVAPDSKTYTVQIGPDGMRREYKTRAGG